MQGLDENYGSLNHLTYSLLTAERQDAYSSFNIPVTTIPLNTPKKDIFSCYEDINSGGEDLTAHQIRRVVHGGAYIDLLEELVKTDEFRKVRDPIKFKQGTYEECKEELDRELILRAFAFKRSHSDFKSPIKYFLNDEVDFVNGLDEKRQKEELAGLKERLGFMLDVWDKVFSGTNGQFRAWVEVNRGRGDWDWNRRKQKKTTISTALWDAMFFVTDEMRTQYPNVQMYIKCKDGLVHAIQQVFETHGTAFAGQVTAKKFLESKDILLQAIRPVLEQANPPRGSRAFRDPDELRKQLFQAQGGKCGICQQTLDPDRILDGRYAHLDHVIPYSQGGATDSNDASLVHAECNLVKGANMVG